MSKAPAFQFYYDRFNSSTSLWDDCQVGQYIRLMICQANKGYVSAKELKKVVHDNDPDVLSKFTEVEPGKFVNNVLDEVLKEREAHRKKQQENGLKGGRPATQKEPNNNPDQNPNNNPDVTSTTTTTSSTTIPTNTTSTKKSAEAPPVEKFNPFDFVPDTWDRTEFMEYWTAHMEVRRKKKNPASPKACELMLKELVRVCPVWSDARGKMEAAIISGWPKYIYDGPSTKKTEPEGGRYAHERVTIFDKA